MFFYSKYISIILIFFLSILSSLESIDSPEKTNQQINCWKRSLDTIKKESNNNSDHLQHLPPQNIEKEIDFNIKSEAINVAKDILNKDRGYGTQIKICLDKVIMLHHEGKHRANASYFTTGICEDIKNLLIFSSENADQHFTFQDKRTGKKLMVLIKEISQQKSLEILKKNYIGFDEKLRSPRNHVVLCFDINGVNKLSDINNNGYFTTAYPCRKDQKFN
jgi:hypothetical protein